MPVAWIKVVLRPMSSSFIPVASICRRWPRQDYSPSCESVPPPRPKSHHISAEKSLEKNPQIQLTATRKQKSKEQNHGGGWGVAGVREEEGGGRRREGGRLA